MALSLHRSAILIWKEPVRSFGSAAASGAELVVESGAGSGSNSGAVSGAASGFDSRADSGTDFDPGRTGLRSAACAGVGTDTPMAQPRSRTNPVRVMQVIDS